MRLYLITIALILTVRVFHPGRASRILGIFPYPSISHQVVYRELMLALRERGHTLVVVTADPINDPSLTNYTEIDVHFLYDELISKVMNELASRNKGAWLAKMRGLTDKLVLLTDRVLSHPEVKKLYAPDSEEKFDLLMIAMMNWPGFSSLAKRFDVPVIGITPCELNLHKHYSIGNPIMPSHPGYWDTEIKVLGKLSLWQRLQNFVHAWRLMHFLGLDFNPKQQLAARKYFETDIRHAADTTNELSLVFVNRQAPISFARPNVPKIINIGGFHISKQIKPLTQDLQEILDQATQGFIYMSLGSNYKSTMLSNRTRGEFLAAFSQLPYIVIWKFESEILPERPDNVITMKWAPQQTILAHPNIKAFIYQGGLQSTEEAVSYAVPVIGVPILADQDGNVNKMVSLGVGKKLEILTVTSPDLLEVIQSVVLDSSYKQRMLKLRDLLNDKPYDLLENAVWWTEHVIRHKGAPHLHSTTADDPWYQRQDMDLIFFVITTLWIVLIIALVSLYKALVYTLSLLNRRQPSVGTEKKVR